MPIVASATVQTTARKPLVMANGPTATIAMAGSQYSMKTRHRLVRMSRVSQVVASDFLLRLLLRYVQGAVRCLAYEVAEDVIGMVKRLLDLAEIFFQHRRGRIVIRASLGATGCGRFR